MNFFQLPIGAGLNDPVVGEVDGAQIRMAPDGTRYYEQYQAPAQRAIIEALTTTLDDQGRAIHDRTPQQPVPGKAIVEALLGGVTQGLTAPGRALRGEPVTYGDAWATALDYGIGSAPTSAPDGALRSGGIKAYHGSPHDFDRFSMDKIGTGEGAQAYGHGLYFAESEDVARSYRDTLSVGGVRYKGEPLRPNAQSPDPEKAAAWAIGRYIADGNSPDIAKGRAANDFAYSARKARTSRKTPWGADDPAQVEKFAGEYDELERLAREMPESDFDTLAGHMYEVNINANPDDFLDWESGLSGQPQKVKDWFDSRGISEGFAGTQSGNELFQAERRAMGDEALARSMSDSGIAGVRYLDHGSRYNAMDGLGPKTDTRNFVVFDEDLISIVRKYGIAGAAAYLGMPEDEIRQRVGGT